jgi:hypothetical protein
VSDTQRCTLSIPTTLIPLHRSVPAERRTVFTHPRGVTRRFTLLAQHTAPSSLDTRITCLDVPRLVCLNRLHPLYWGNYRYLRSRNVEIAHLYTLPMAILISHMDHHHNPQEAEEPAHLELKHKDNAPLIKKKPHRWYMALRNRWFRNSSSIGSSSSSSSFSWRSYFAVTNVSVCLVGTILVILSTHRVISLIMTHRRWINAPSTYEHRACPNTAYETLAAGTSSDGAAAGTGLKICLTTLTDQKSPSRLQRAQVCPKTRLPFGGRLEAH